jgi:hypothetical protein
VILITCGLRWGDCTAEKTYNTLSKQLLMDNNDLKSNETLCASMN